MVGPATCPMAKKNVTKAKPFAVRAGPSLSATVAETTVGMLQTAMP